MPQLGLLLWIPILDTISKIQGTNDLRPNPLVHVQESFKDWEKRMSSLAFLAAKTLQGVLT